MIDLAVIGCTFTATNRLPPTIYIYIYVSVCISQYKLLTTDAQENIEEAVAKATARAYFREKRISGKPIVSLSDRISLLIRFAFG